MQKRSALAARGPKIIACMLIFIWTGQQTGRTQGLPAIISAGEDHQIKQWDGQGKSAACDVPQDAAITTMALIALPEGPALVSADSKGTLEIHDIAKGTRLFRQENAHAGSILALAVSPDGKWIATGGADRHIRLWNPETKRCVADAEAHQDAVSALRFFDRGAKLLSGSADKMLRIWRVRAQGKAAVLEYESNITGHDDTITALAIAPDGRTFASASRDKMLRIWRVGGDGLDKSYHGGERGLLAIAYSPDGRYLAAGDEDGHIRLFDLQKGNAASVSINSERAVRALVFSNEGKIIVSGNEDGKIHYWDAASGREIKIIDAHKGAVSVLMVAP